MAVGTLGWRMLGAVVLLALGQLDFNLESSLLQEAPPPWPLGRWVGPSPWPFFPLLYLNGQVGVLLPPVHHLLELIGEFIGKVSFVDGECFLGNFISNNNFYPHCNVHLDQRGITWIHYTDLAGSGMGGKRTYERGTAVQWRAPTGTAVQ